MQSEELFQTFLDRLSEARVYLEQGLEDGARELYGEILSDIEQSLLSESEKDQLRSCIELETEDPEGIAFPGILEEQNEESASRARQHYEYGLALMDGQFWEEAIGEFGRAAEMGYDSLKCWEACGDCAFRQEKWDAAAQYYRYVYADETIPEELRKRILLKISKCSQTRKKVEIDSAFQARNGAAAVSENACAKSEFITSSIFSLDGYSVNSMLGKTVSSWTGPACGHLPGTERIYRVTNLLQVGSSSLIVELESEEDGEKFAGQNLTGPFGEILCAEELGGWVRQQMLADSRHMVKISDLAHSEGYFFIVREYFPLSLNDILSAGQPIPIPIAVHFAYQVLEALGDLHLHMGKDETIRNIFHLDLRPSRVLVRKDRPYVKIYNGGLWKEMERAAPERTAIKALPVPYLSYRAPEQFRPYLLRKRPPVFTDIYLFGSLFYEMLTGTPAFKGSSYEEYEIQHCEQYPMPPKVWRPEIPDVLNEMIMKCLEGDPMKRWRSTTQMSLILEKAFSGAVTKLDPAAYGEYLEKLKLA